MNIYQKLCKDIEAATKQRYRTPKDFDRLRERIFGRLQVYVSSTTLKRMWGYLGEDVTPRLSTLNILSQFLGYQDWEDYLERSDLEKDGESNPIMSRRISVGTDLVEGDIVMVTWQPDRELEMVYLGNMMFRIERSENSRLTAGTTFRCGVIIHGEPLFLDNVCVPGLKSPAPAYVCGKRSGVHYELRTKDQTKD